MSAPRDLDVISSDRLPLALATVGRAFRSELSNLLSTRLVLLALLFSWGLLSVDGFKFPLSNNQFHIPIVLEHYASAEGPHDAFTRSLQNFVSPFWLLVQKLVTEESIYPVFLGIYSLSILALVWFFLTLVSEQGWNKPHTRWGFVTAGSLFFLPLLFGISMLGRHEVRVLYLTHSQVVAPFALLAMLLVVRGRHVGAALVLGIAFNVNAFVATWLGAAAGVTMLATERHRPLAVRARDGGTMLGVFLLLAGPTLLWIWRTQVNAPEYPDFDYIAFLREYYPYHNLIDVAIPAALWTVTIALWMWASILVSTREATARLAVSLRGIGASLTAILMLGVVLPYLTRSRLIHNLYPLRMDAYVYWMIAICCGASLVTLGRAKSETTANQLGLWSALFDTNVLLGLVFLREEQGRSSRALTVMLVVSAAVSVVLASVFDVTWAVHAPVPFLGLQSAVVLAQCVVLGIAAAESRAPGRLFAISTLAWAPLLFSANSRLASLVVVLLLVAGVGSALTDRMQRFAFLSSGVAPLVMIVDEPGLSRHWMGLFAVLLFWIAWWLRGESALWSRARIQSWQLPALFVGAMLVVGVVRIVERPGLLARTPEQEAYVEAQEWSRANTPPDTMHMLIGVDSFSVLSRRPSWVDVRQGAVVMWAPELYETWSTRVAEVESLETLSAAMGLARREDIDYIVVGEESFEDEPAFADDVVFQNDSYRIYRVTT